MTSGPSFQQPPVAPACINHPDRPAAVPCQRCGSPICGQCMIEAPVGFQCPRCVATASANVKAGRPAWRQITKSSRATLVLVGINVAVWLAIVLTGWRHSPVANYLGLNLLPLCDLPGDSLMGLSPEQCAGMGGAWAPGTADFAWWKLLTNGFTHTDPIHLLFNMIVLWMLGPQLDRFFGTSRFLALYLTSILTASAFALWLSPENVFGQGASGGVFGLIGALLVVTVLQRGDVRSIVVWLGINVAFMVWGAGFISWQAHLGGFVGGCVVTYALMKLQYRPPNQTWAVIAAVSGLSIIASIARGFLV